MSRSLRAARLALHPARGFLQRFFRKRQSSIDAIYRIANAIKSV